MYHLAAVGRGRVKEFIFSDLIGALQFFKKTERINIIPESLETRIVADNLLVRTRFLFKGLNSAIFHKSEFKSQRLVFNMVKCWVFEQNGELYTTIDRFLTFLRALGLLYRPDMEFPSIQIEQKAVFRAGIKFLPYKVIEKNGLDFFAYGAESFGKRMRDRSLPLTRFYEERDIVEEWERKEYEQEKEH